MDVFFTEFVKMTDQNRISIYNKERISLYNELQTLNSTRYNFQIVAPFREDVEKSGKSMY